MFGQTIVSQKKNKFLVKDFWVKTIFGKKNALVEIFLLKNFWSKKIFIKKNLVKKISDTQRQK